MDLEKLRNLALDAQDDVADIKSYMDSVGRLHEMEERAFFASAADRCLESLGVGSIPVRINVIKLMEEIIYGDLDLAEP